MSSQRLPFNISLLKLSPERLRFTKPVTSLDITDGASNQLHEDGLFSVSIFGRIGDAKRDETFSFINLNTEILHPIVFECYTRLKGFYREIMTGKEYARWDAETNDFVKSDPVEGETGYSFFVKHCLDIEFEKSKSIIRSTRIQVIEKYKDSAKTKQALVLPAGLRDIEIGDDGRIQQHEVNDLYRRMIAISNLLASTYDIDNPAVNQSRAALQLTFCEVYNLFESIIKGKGGFGQNKFASRRIYNGTQNVISAMDPSTADMDAPNALTLNDTVVGLFQAMKAIEPMTAHFLKSSFISGIFDDSGSSRGLLVNPATLRPEWVTVSPRQLDLWTSYEGLLKIIEMFREDSYRSRPVMVDGYYLSLIYLGPEGSFKILNNIDELPADRKPEDVHPITYGELLYLAGYREWNKFPSFVTRYPITNIGSIYPSKMYVKTTIDGEVRKELNEEWQPIGDSYVAYEFPSRSKPIYVDTMSPNLVRLQDLGGDKHQCPLYLKESSVLFFNC